MKIARALLLCMVLGAPGLALAQTPVKVKAGMVTGIDCLRLNRLARMVIGSKQQSLLEPNDGRRGLALANLSLQSRGAYVA